MQAVAAAGACETGVRGASPNAGGAYASCDVGRFQPRWFNSGFRRSPIRSGATRTRSIVGRWRRRGAAVGLVEAPVEATPPFRVPDSIHLWPRLASDSEELIRFVRRAENRPYFGARSRPLLGSLSWLRLRPMIDKLGPLGQTQNRSKCLPVAYQSLAREMFPCRSNSRVPTAECGRRLVINSPAKRVLADSAVRR